MMIDRRTLLGGAAGGFALIGAQARAAGASPVAFDKSAVVHAAAKLLRDTYVDPAQATRLADLLLANLKAGSYDAISDPVEFASRLTDDLRAATHDLHLNVEYDPPEPQPENAEIIAEDDLHPRITGYGVQTVARLPGNIGLLRVTHFPSPPKRFADRYAAAMDLLQDTDALVLDLTINHGGGADTSAFFLSYFLDPGIVVSRSISRNAPSEILSTEAKVPGPRYGTARPMFVAISGNTFSAGEGVSATLKKLGRAKLVGARTRGGAHMGDTVKLPDGFQIFVVTGKGEGPDWEGIGVAPDVAVQPEYAVATAHRLAQEALLLKATDPKRAQVLRNVLGHSIENLSSFSF